MTSDPASDPAGELDGYLQRAELLAELGRYDEAVAELGFAVSLAPGDSRAPAMLARVHLAADRPAQALTAAESALAGATGAGSRSGEPAAGGDPAGRGEGGADASIEVGSGGGQLTALRTQVIRGFALADLRRFGEAAQVAAEILTAAPADPYAQRSGAAILAESRNGQPALNAAWRGVELDPAQAQAHLVLSLVSARLGLFDLAERAYRAALELDPQLPEAARDVGVIRLERRRYAAALEAVTESTISTPERPSPDAATGGHPDAARYPAQPSRADGDPSQEDDPPRSDPSWPIDPARSEPSGPVGPPGGSAHRPGPWAATTVADGLRRLVLYGAGYAVVAAVLVACLAAGNPAQSRVAAVLAAIGGGAVLWVLAARTPKLVGTILPALLRQDRALALAGYAALAGPVLILVYALVGTPWPLVLAIAATAAAELVVLRRPLPPPRA